jgi:hypothetical protein
MECPYLDGNLIQNQQKRERTEEKEEEKISIPSSRLDTPLCRFFVLGKCRYGSLCTYSHQLPTFFSSNEEEDTSVHFGSMVACPFFLRGNCKYGDFCKLRHSNPSKRSNTQAINTQVTTILEYTCGICFDDIVASGKRFGLMSKLRFILFL